MESNARMAVAHTNLVLRDENEKAEEILMFKTKHGKEILTW